MKGQSFRCWCSRVAKCSACGMGPNVVRMPPPDDLFFSSFFSVPSRLARRARRGVWVRWSAGKGRKDRADKDGRRRRSFWRRAEAGKVWEGEQGALQKWHKYCKVPGWGRVPPPPESTARLGVATAPKRWMRRGTGAGEFTLSRAHVLDRLFFLLLRFLF